MLEEHEVSSTHELPSRPVLERDHVELLGRLAVHAVVLDPAGPEGGGPCNGKQKVPCLLTAEQTHRAPPD